MKRVLVVGPGKRTRGGITSVIKAHKSTDAWSKWNCYWISTYIDRGWFLKILFFLKGLMFFVIKLPFYDGVHIHFSEHISASRKFLFLRIAKLFKKKVIVHFHAFSADSTLFGDKKHIYQNIFELSDLIIALSDSWKRNIEHLGISPDKVFVTYNPCPNIKMKTSLARKKNILYAGTINDRKGYKILLKAFANIKKNKHEWELVFAGNGEIEEANKMVYELGLEGNVHFTGWVSGKKKDELFSKSSIFCLPSYAEGFPMAVLDAFSYGLPVITTPVGGLPDILSHGKDVLFFTPGNINELTDAINNLIENDALMQSLSVASLRLSTSTFHINYFGDKLDRIYTMLYK